MRRLLILLVVLGGALAQTLEVGVWAGGPRFTLGPTLALTLPQGDTRFGLYFRGYLPRVDEFAIGGSVDHSWPLVPAGRAEVGLKGFTGLDGQYWVEGQGSATAGQVAARVRLGFTANRPPSHFWPLAQESLGPYARLALDYRLARKLALLGRADYKNEAGRVEAGVRFFQDKNRYLLGLGAYRQLTNAYAWLGWRGPVEGGAVLEAELRVGGYNAFTLGYATRALKLKARATYPIRLDLEARWEDWTLGAAFTRAAYTFHLSRRFALE